MNKILKTSVRETDDEFHVECIFFDGQKFSAVIVDKSVPEAQNLVMTICDLLQSNILSRSNNPYLVKSNTRENLEIKEIISGIQAKTGILIFEKQCLLERTILENIETDILIRLHGLAGKILEERMNNE